MENIQKVLEEIWKEILGIDKIDYDTSFLELGADSLRFVKCTNLISERLGIEIEITDVFFNETINDLADFIKTKM